MFKDNEDYNYYVPCKTGEEVNKLYEKGEKVILLQLEELQQVLIGKN